MSDRAIGASPSESICDILPLDICVIRHWLLVVLGSKLLAPIIMLSASTQSKSNDTSVQEDFCFLQSGRLKKVSGVCRCSRDRRRANLVQAPRLALFNGLVE